MKDYQYGTDHMIRKVDSIDGYAYAYQKARLMIFNLKTSYRPGQVTATEKQVLQRVVIEIIIYMDV